MDLLYVLILVGIVGVALGVYFLTQDTSKSVSTDDILDTLEHIIKAQKELTKQGDVPSNNSESNTLAIEVESGSST